MRASTRLGLAAAVCLLSLGLPWRTTFTWGPQSSLTTHHTSPWSSDVTYMITYFGSAMPYEQSGAKSDERVVLVPAAAVLALAATGRSRSYRRAARVAVVTLGITVVIGFSRGLPGGPLAALVAVVLAAPALDWSDTWIARRLARLPRRTAS